MNRVHKLDAWPLSLWDPLPDPSPVVGYKYGPLGNGGYSAKPAPFASNYASGAALFDTNPVLATLLINNMNG